MAEYTPRPLTTNEQAANGGMTHIATITANSLTTTASNTAQTITLCALKAGDIVMKVAWRCKTFFKASGDNAFNSTTMSVGDTASVTAFIAALQVNANGATVKQGFTNTAIHFAATDIFTVTFNAMSAKNLNALNTGEVEILFQVLRPAALETAGGALLITK